MATQTSTTRHSTSRWTLRIAIVATTGLAALLAGVGPQVLAVPGGLSAIESPGTRPTPLAPAVRVDAPDAAIVATGLPPVPNRSTCRTDATTPALTVTMTDIAYTCPVYAGGQDVIDAGRVALMTIDAISAALAGHPGDAGTLWIAAHRTSHGGAFAAVPDLADGALVTVTDATTTATYRIVGRARLTVRNDRVVDAAGNATGAATLDSILRADHGGNGAARLLLQTCDGADVRWMIYGDLVSTSPVTG